MTGAGVPHLDSEMWVSDVDTPSSKGVVILAKPESLYLPFCLSFRSAAEESASDQPLLPVFTTRSDPSPTQTPAPAPSPARSRDSQHLHRFTRPINPYRPCLRLNQPGHLHPIRYPLLHLRELEFPVNRKSSCSTESCARSSTYSRCSRRSKEPARSSTVR